MSPLLEADLLKNGGLLIRGRHLLPHQCQMIHRDMMAERIAKHPGATVLAYRLTGEQLQERRDGKRGTGLPYEFLVYSPQSPAFNMTAFFTAWDFGDWMEAYGIKIDGTYPQPGQQFHVRFPDTVKAFLPLCETQVVKS